MTYRRCRNPHPTPEGEEPITEGEIIEMAMECFGWDRKKVKSWYLKENPRLKKARPSELVDRGLGYLVVEFLKLKNEERLVNERTDQKRKDERD